MKAKVLLIIVLAVFYFGGFKTLAQKVPDPLEPAYIVTLKKDTIKGYITVINKIARQQQITYYSDPNNVRTRHFYEADRIKGYGVGDVYYESIPYNDGTSKYEKNFAVRVISGKMSLYHWYIIDPYTKNKKTYKPMELIDEKDLVIDPLLKKDKGIEVKNIHTMEFSNFKKAFPEFIRENKDLAKKVADKIYSIKDLEIIVQEYNQTVKKR